jgi:SAM-dependent methyltransferase
MKVSNFDTDNPPGELDALACKFRTDKGSNGTHGHGYTRWYAPLFAPLKTEPINILEIGVSGGASLKLWEAYFPNANIVGLDINEKMLSMSRPRVEVLMVNTGVPLRLQQFMEAGRKFDVIIDDGSHVLEDVVLALDHLWPAVKPGGLYFIEDLGCNSFPTTPIITSEEVDAAKLRWGKHYCSQMAEFHRSHDSESLMIYPSQNRYGETPDKGGQSLVVFRKKA